MRDKIPQLSKSRFIAGLQCHKRLYLECYHYDERDEITSAQQAIFDSGTKVGDLARKYIPDGILIDEDHTQQVQANDRTADLVKQGDVEAIYEAGFTFDDIKIRVDILRNNHDGTYDIIEVKSSTKPKDEHIDDIAIQTYVLKGCGIELKNYFLMTIDSSYEYQGGEYEVEKLFKLHDLTEQVDEKMDQVLASLNEMRKPLQEASAPCREIGGHCKKPYTCSFYSYCHKGLPEDHITKLPRISEKNIKLLRSQNIQRIPEIPDDFSKLTATQFRARESVINKSVFYGQDLYNELRDLVFPLYFIDFETFNPALPAYIGTRPYLQVPFQWSTHILSSDGKLDHHEFLANGLDDPRILFAESLIDVLADQGTILVYSSFEKSRLNEIAKVYPDLQDKLEAITDRFIDLLALLRRDFYHPDFRGSFSIKTVLPALVPDLRYDGLGIKEGATAAASFEKSLQPDCPEIERKRIRGDLLAYCKQDTLAMVEIYKALLDLERFPLSA